LVLFVFATFHHQNHPEAGELIAAAGVLGWVLPPTSPLKGPKVSRNFLKKMMVVLQTSQTKPTTLASL